MRSITSFGRWVLIVCVTVASDRTAWAAEVTPKRIHLTIQRTHNILLGRWKDFPIYCNGELVGYCSNGNTSRFHVPVSADGNYRLAVNGENGVSTAFYANADEEATVQVSLPLTWAGGVKVDAIRVLPQHKCRVFVSVDQPVDVAFEGYVKHLVRSEVVELPISAPLTGFNRVMCKVSRGTSVEEFPVFLSASRTAYLGLQNHSDREAEYLATWEYITQLRAAMLFYFDGAEPEIGDLAEAFCRSAESLNRRAVSQAAVQLRDAEITWARNVARWNQESVVDDAAKNLVVAAASCGLEMALTRQAPTRTDALIGGLTALTDSIWDSVERRAKIKSECEEIVRCEAGVLAELADLRAGIRGLDEHVVVKEDSLRAQLIGEWSFELPIDDGLTVSYEFGTRGELTQYIWRWHLIESGKTMELRRAESSIETAWYVIRGDKVYIRWRHGQDEVAQFRKKLDNAFEYEVIAHSDKRQQGWKMLMGRVTDWQPIRRKPNFFYIPRQ